MISYSFYWFTNLQSPIEILKKLALRNNLLGFKQLETFTYFREIKVNSYLEKQRLNFQYFHIINIINRNVVETAMLLFSYFFLTLNECSL